MEFPDADDGHPINPFNPSLVYLAGPSLQEAPLEGNQEGNPLSPVPPVEELVDQGRLKLTLRDYEQRLDSILNSVEDVIWSMSPDLSHMLYINSWAERVYGRPVQEFLSHAQLWFEVIHPEDQAAALAAVDRLCSTGKCSFEYRIRRPDGTVRWLHDRAYLIYGEEGQPLRVDGIASDITDRKKAEAALQESEERFRAVFNNLSVGIALVNPDGYVAVANEADCRFLGYSHEELIGMHYSAFTYPEDLEVDSLLFQSLVSGERENYQIDKRYIRKDGTIVWGRLTVSLIRNPDQSIRYTTVTCEDITDRKRAEQEREKAETDLRQKAGREQLMATITNRIRRSLDLSATLNTAVVEIRQLLQADRVLVYRFNPDWSGVVTAESVGEGWQPLLGRVITDACFTVENCITPYLRGRIQNTPDIQTAQLPDCYVAMLAQIQVRANLVLPVLQGETLWGLLVAQQCAHARIWHPEEISLLQQLADQLAIALQQAELYQQVQRLNTRLEEQVEERTAQLQQSLEFEALLRRITDQVRDSLDEHQILQTAVEALALGLHLECCDTEVYNEERTTATIVCEQNHHLKPALGKSFLIAEGPHPEIYEQLLKGQSCHFCDVAPNPLRSNQYRFTVFACPIFVGIAQEGAKESLTTDPVPDVLLGGLWLLRQPGSHFNAQEMRLVEQVANQCAIAIRQARLYQAAQAQVQTLERLNQLKDDFLSTVSHELRSPMANIKMALQMLEVALNRADMSEPENPASDRLLKQIVFAKVMQYCQILSQESQREINLINDLLDLTRLEAGSVPMNLMTLSLQQWIPTIAAPFVARSRQHQLTWRMEIPEDLPPFATHAESLERILTELFHNACKYTPAGEQIGIQVQIDCPSPHGSETLCITVSNSGVEIPREEQKRIFDKFYRIPNADPWKYGGTGLGLALVKRLLEYLGGTIQVQSAQLLTQFMITLPLRTSLEEVGDSK